MRRPGRAGTLGSEPGRAGSGMTLGIAMGLGNLLSYVFVLVLTHALGTAGFGAYTAIITLGIVLVIPAGAFQVIVARRWPQPAQRTSGVNAALATGVALTVVTAAASPAIAALLHLDGVSATIAMSLMLVPMTVTGAFQGVLLGSGRLGRLATLYLVTAFARLAGAFGCAASGVGVTGVFVTMALASWVAAAYGLFACRDLVARAPRHHASLVGEMVRSNSTLAAFTALTNMDVVLVRHFLDAHTSGGYGLASTFGRAMCWGTQFIALLVVPRLSSNARTVIWKAAGIVVVIGAAAAAVVAIDADQLVRLIGGDEFAEFGPLVLGCIGLGTVWALAQLWLFSQMADDDTTLGVLAWVMVVAELGLGWFVWHDSATQVVALAAACAGVVVVVGALRTRTRRVRRLETDETLLVVDHA